MDGSIHNWFGTDKTCLHLAIDLCTGTIVSGIFQNQETLKGYYITFKQILEKYGIPVLFKTDNRTVFNYESLTKEKKTSDKDVLAQFGYACQILGVDLKTTSVSQAKGTIERVNEYLINKFIPNFNKRFALNYRKFPNAFDKSPSKEKINYTLAILSTRKIDNGNSIKFKGKYYQPYNNKNQLQCFISGTECLVIEAFNGSLLVTINNEVYLLNELKKHKQFSIKLDNLIDKLDPKKVYIPKMSHP